MKGYIEIVLYYFTLNNLIMCKLNIKKIKLNHFIADQYYDCGICGQGCDCQYSNLITRYDFDKLADAGFIKSTDSSGMSVTAHLIDGQSIRSDQMGDFVL